MSNPDVLWVDDEIDLLRSHVMFLEDRDYDVSTVANGADAVDMVREDPFDVVLLDEQMPGMQGLEVLDAIKEERPEMPVVLVTKSEEEDLMEAALGSQISDYLTKPVNPSQVLLTCKRLLEQSKLRRETLSQRYLQSFNEISAALQESLSPDEWIDLYQRLVQYDLELTDDEGARQIFQDQYEEADRTFGTFVESRYPAWIDQIDAPPGQNRPVLSHEVVPEFVLPEVGDAPVVFFVIDCLRYDQWLELAELLRPHYNVDTDFYMGILPTATPYSRNAIFSGMLPVDLVDRFPKAWQTNEENEHSRNQYEEALLHHQLDQHHHGDLSVRYDKLITSEDGQTLTQDATNLTQHDLSAVVVNFIDILAHSRSESDVLKELAPDEEAYRALTRTWFEHSWLYDMLRTLADTECTVVITTDHGAVRSLQSTKVIGDRETSTALRYKYGSNLKCDEDDAILVREPERFGLPSYGINTNYLIAKEDYYFVYPTDFHHYENLYRDTLQHGGASMEEMILPVATLRPKA
ncbi:MAG: response regulator [Salinibacter sp.]|uniref:T9SS response regulator signal transducer PorX n=1 Tax=Salinibacter sp. TaxID=2065818 RepID=UPI0035D48C22